MIKNEYLQLVGPARRSGKRLELIFGVKDEALRIRQIIDYYAPFGDLVLFDGGSTDGTIEIAQQMGCTVMHRVSLEITEKLFAFYVNHLTLSGRCFILFADEVIEREDLKKIDNFLMNAPAAVAARRVDYIYSHEMKSCESFAWHGFTKGTAAVDESRLHGLLMITKSAVPTKTMSVPVLHFHPWSMAHSFGQCAVYAKMEIAIMRQQKKWLWRFWKRYFLSKIWYFIRLRWILDGKTGLFFLVFNALEFFVAVLCLWEMDWFPDKTRQGELLINKLKE